MISVFKKEFTSYFSGLFGWTLLAWMTLSIGLMTLLMNLISTTVDLSYAVFYLADLLILFIPFVAAHTFTSENICRTAPWLRSLPISPLSVLVGKYLAAFSLLSIPTILLLILPVILANFGTVSFGTAYTLILGYILLSAALLAFCAWFATSVSRKLVAILGGIGVLLGVFLLSVIPTIISYFPVVSFVLFLLVFIGIGLLIALLRKNVLAGLLTAILPSILLTILFLISRELYASVLSGFFSFFDVFGRLKGFSGGRSDLPSVFFYLGLVTVFLAGISLLPHQNLQKRGDKQ